MPTDAANTRWTYARMVAELPPDSRYELHDGILLDMSPSPSGFHQDIVGNLYLLFRLFLANHPVGKVFVAPLDVVLGEGEVVQPDLLILLGDPGRKVEGPVLETPELLVEVLSPGSVYRDQVEKRALYAQCGVQEYWIVDPDAKSVEINRLQDGVYLLHAFATGAGAITSALLPDLTVGLGEVFG